jgi:NADH-quinone oxidoreductase subunit J
METVQIIFYILAAVIFGATVLAVSCRQVMHAALYFIVSLLGLAMLFFLLGAPLLAALEVILYAGAIMMLLLFVIMMLHTDRRDRELYRPSFWTVPVLLSLLCGAALAMLLARWPQAAELLPSAFFTPSQFGQVLFGRYWLAVELVSLLLFVALVGALYLGGREIMAARLPGEGGGS